jgi:hypothetical protein
MVERRAAARRSTMRDFETITSLGDGRVLVATTMGDQYFVQDETGAVTRVSTLEAVRLLQQARQLSSARTPKAKTLRKRKRADAVKSKPVSREELEELERKKT